MLVTASRLRSWEELFDCGDQDVLGEPLVTDPVCHGAVRAEAAGLVEASGLRWGPTLLAEVKFPEHLKERGVEVTFNIV